MTTSNKSLALAVTSALALTIGAASIHAAENPFAIKSLSSGYQVAEADGKMKDGKCGTGKCGAGMKKEMEKAGEGKCSAEMKSKEGSCHGDMKAKEGSCSAAKAKEGSCHSDKK